MSLQTLFYQRTMNHFLLHLDCIFKILKKVMPKNLKQQNVLHLQWIAVELIKTLPMNVFIILLKYLRTNS